MKKKLLSLILLGILIMPIVVLAQVDSIQSLSVAIARVLWVVFAVIVLICFIVAGIAFLTAMGEPEKIKNARSAFLWGIVGIVVGIVAYSIISIISVALS